MLKRLAWLYRVPAVVFATLLLLAGADFGSSRDFGSFLYSIPTLGLLFLGAVVATVWATCIKSQRGRAAVALVLICLTPLVYLCAYGTAQRIRFLLWAPAHYRQLAQASEKDGIITGWDSWGMAGEDTFSYLVVDTQDRLGSKARADQPVLRDVARATDVAKTLRCDHLYRLPVRWRAACGLMPARLNKGHRLSPPWKPEISPAPDGKGRVLAAHCPRGFPNYGDSALNSPT